MAIKSELVLEIQKCSTDLIEQTGFLVPDYTELISHCKKLLLEMGYKVVKPMSTRFKATKIDDLFNLFYDRLSHYHPDQSVYMNLKKDRSIASRFLKARMEAGDVNKRQALSECAEIILTVFEHEDEFNFNLPLTFEMFGQAKCAWITEKSIEIINAKKAKIDEKLVNKMIDDYNEEYIKEHGISSIAFLTKIEEAEDGKKEKGTS